MGIAPVQVQVLSSAVNADKVIRNDDLFSFSKNSLRPIWFEAFCFLVALQGFLEKENEIIFKKNKKIQKKVKKVLTNSC